MLLRVATLKLQVWSILGINSYKIRQCQTLLFTIVKPSFVQTSFTMAAEYWKIANCKKLQCIIVIKCYLTIDHNCMTQAILYLESILLGKFSDSLARDVLHMSTDYGYTERAFFSKIRTF